MKVMLQNGMAATEWAVKNKKHSRVAGVFLLHKLSYLIILTIILVCDIIWNIDFQAVFA